MFRSAAGATAAMARRVLVLAAGVASVVAAMDFRCVYADVLS